MTPACFNFDLAAPLWSRARLCSDSGGNACVGGRLEGYVDGRGTRASIPGTLPFPYLHQLALGRAPLIEGVGVLRLECKWEGGCACNWVGVWAEARMPHHRLVLAPPASTSTWPRPSVRGRACAPTRTRARARAAATWPAGGLKRGVRGGVRGVDEGVGRGVNGDMFDWRDV